jgi:hypothetical protein
VADHRWLMRCVGESGLRAARALKDRLDEQAKCMVLPKVIINGDERYYVQAVEYLIEQGRAKFEAECAVRTMLISLREPTRKAKEALRDIHLDARVINEGLRSAMRDIASACFDRSINRFTLVCGLFGHEHAQSAYALLEKHIAEVESELPNVAQLAGIKR